MPEYDGPPSISGGTYIFSPQADPSGGLSTAQQQHLLSYLTAEYSCSMCGGQVIGRQNMYANGCANCKNPEDAVPIRQQCVQCGRGVSYLKAADIPETGPRCANCLDLKMPVKPWDYQIDGSRILTKRPITNRTRTYGWELEIAVPLKNWMRANELLDATNRSIESAFTLIHDGSVMRGNRYKPVRHGVGFEITTQPMTWAWWADNRDTFYELLRNLVGMGAVSHLTTTCGFHVHIGGLSEPARKALLYLVLGDPEIPLVLSRRAGTSYCYFPEISAHKLAGENYRNLDRYGAASYTKHDTVELRFFRGTLYPPTLQACMEYSRAAAAYAVASSGAWTKVTTDDFLRHVLDHPRKFGNLIRYLAKRKVLTV